MLTEKQIEEIKEIIDELFEDIDTFKFFLENPNLEIPDSPTYKTPREIVDFYTKIIQNHIKDIKEVC